MLLNVKISTDCSNLSPSVGIHCYKLSDSCFSFFLSSPPCFTPFHVVSGLLSEALSWGHWLPYFYFKVIIPYTDVFTFKYLYFSKLLKLACWENTEWLRSSAASTFLLPSFKGLLNWCLSVQIEVICYE